MSIYFRVLFMNNTSVERPFVLVCRREKELVLKLHIHIKMGHKWPLSLQRDWEYLHVSVHAGFKIPAGGFAGGIVPVLYRVHWCNPVAGYVAVEDMRPNLNIQAAVDLFFTVVTQPSLFLKLSVYANCYVHGKLSIGLNFKGTQSLNTSMRTRFSF